jgi:hypothetical protein
VIDGAAGVVNPAARTEAITSDGGKMSFLGCQMFSENCWEADAEGEGMFAGRWSHRVFASALSSGSCREVDADAKNSGGG